MGTEKADNHMRLCSPCTPPLKNKMVVVTPALTEFALPSQSLVKIDTTIQIKLNCPWAL